MYELLKQITKPNDIKKISEKDYPRLAKEIRHFLVTRVSKSGGHLASNLGTVELTMALHLCLNLPEDKIVWDVGHQAYTHKLLTGRMTEFPTLRQYQGMSGFPKRGESECDAFDTGHSSTSISVALGYAYARDLQGQNHKVVAVIGDGALSGGMAYEALNNAAELKSNLIIILNDNAMSISDNVGGMAGYLGGIRTSSRYLGLKEDVENALKRMPGIGDKLVEQIRGAKDSIKRLFIPGMWFEDMGLTYIGPINGHDINQMREAIQNASMMQETVIIHVHTKKGKGYVPAENNPSDYHGVSPFDVKKGIEKEEKPEKTYTEWFSDTMLELGEKENKLLAITAAMPDGTGLTGFSKTYPERFFDVGIAEEHAVTFAAGLAAGGLKPVVAIYSTFLQRAYDQMIHDVCIGKLPVIFAIDRAGIVGNDGETHQGIFDLSYLSTMPGMTIMAPATGRELKEMLKMAVSEVDGPVAIRYPRGNAWEADSYLEQGDDLLKFGKAKVMQQGRDILLWAEGNMVQQACVAAELLLQEGIEVTVVNARFIKPLDEELLKELLATHSLVVTIEENISHGGMGTLVAEYLRRQNSSCRHVLLALPDEFITHGDSDLLRSIYGLTGQEIAGQVKRIIG